MALDANHDGLLDVYPANDFGPNTIYLNFTCCCNVRNWVDCICRLSLNTQKLLSNLYVRRRLIRRMFTMRNAPCAENDAPPSALSQAE